MAYLEIGLQGTGVTVGDDPNKVVSIDYDHVASASRYANRIFKDETATDSEKELANAVISLTHVLAEIVRGLDHGRIGVHNYPVEGAHLT